MILRSWQDADRLPFRELNSDPQVMRHFPQLLSAEHSDLLMERWQERIGRQGWGFWAVERVVDGAFLGAVGLGNVTFNAPFAPAVEIGWRLLPLHWRKGYALEAARQALRVGFEQVELQEIVAFTLPANLPSRGVMQRLGMRHDRSSDFPHPNLPDGHPMRRHVLYRLSRRDWRRSDMAPA